MDFDKWACMLCIGYYCTEPNRGASINKRHGRGYHWSSWHQVFLVCSLDLLTNCGQGWPVVALTNTPLIGHAQSTALALLTILMHCTWGLTRLSPHRRREPAHIVNWPMATSNSTQTNNENSELAVQKLWSMLTPAASWTLRLVETCSRFMTTPVVILAHPKQVEL